MSALWYYTTGGKRMEPVTSAELKQLATSGFLKPTDLVWKEGMANWEAASSLKGLFPAGAAAPPAPSTAVRSGEAASPRSLADDPDEVPRRRRQPIDDAEDDVDDRRRRRRERSDDDRPRRSKGISGLAIGLIIGGVVVAIVIVVGIIVVVAVVNRDPNQVANYSLNLQRSQFQFRTFHFDANTLYEMTVTSDGDTDVDLLVLDTNQNVVGGDQTIGPNSRIRWSPPASGNYQVEVRNLDQVSGNRSRVLIRKVGRADGPVGNAVQGLPGARFQPVAPPGIPNPGQNVPDEPIAGPTESVTTGVLLRGRDWTRQVTFSQAKMVTVAVSTREARNDVDLFVVDSDNKQVAQDIRISANCRVSFTARENVAYTLRVRNLGPLPTACTVTYTQP